MHYLTRGVLYIAFPQKVVMLRITGAGRVRVTTTQLTFLKIGCPFAI